VSCYGPKLSNIHVFQSGRSSRYVKEFFHVVAPSKVSVYPSASTFATPTMMPFIKGNDEEVLIIHVKPIEFFPHKAYFLLK